MAKPVGTYKCVACESTWDGSELYEDPQILGSHHWTCGDLYCGANVRKISDMPKKVKLERQFTGEGLAQAHLLHLTTEQTFKYLQNKTNRRAHRLRFHSKKLKLIKSPGKIFFIRFPDERGAIIMGDNEDDALINAVIFLDRDDAHHCDNPHYDKSCDKCVTEFDELAEKLNRATVTWLGWGQPDYNWVIHT